MCGRRRPARQADKPYRHGDAHVVAQDVHQPDAADQGERDGQHYDELFGDVHATDGGHNDVLEIPDRHAVEIRKTQVLLAREALLINILNLDPASRA
jgi:hypothetical protein